MCVNEGPLSWRGGDSQLQGSPRFLAEVKDAHVILHVEDIGAAANQIQFVLAYCP